MAAAESTCMNCEGVLCSNAIGGPGCISGPHHAHLATWTSTSPANAQCTRAPVVRVGRVSQCPYRAVLIGGREVVAMCNHPKGIARCVVPNKSQLPRECPLRKNSGAGITLKPAVKG